MLFSAAGVCRELSDTLYDVLMLINEDGVIVSRAHMEGRRPPA